MDMSTTPSAGEMLLEHCHQCYLAEARTNNHIWVAHYAIFNDGKGQEPLAAVALC